VDWSSVEGLKDMRGSANITSGRCGRERDMGERERETWERETYGGGREREIWERETYERERVYERYGRERYGRERDMGHMRGSANTTYEICHMFVMYTTYNKNGVAPTLHMTYFICSVGLTTRYEGSANTKPQSSATNCWCGSSLFNSALPKEKQNPRIVPMSV